MTWLLTGGAGYIGAHVILAFREAGTDVVVLDDLSTGYREFVPAAVAFVEGSTTDPDALAGAMDDHDVTGVLHLAGLKYAGVSVAEPLRFFRQNVTGMQVLLEAVEQRGIERFVLSSSASWYGTPASEIVSEDAPAHPQSPYGQTKVASEWLLRDVAVVRPAVRHTSLRYFNVVGSGPAQLADRSPHNLFPKVMGALSRGQRPTVNGVDYPTPDGSCIRDYVHVLDVAEAHVLAAQRLDAGEPCAPVYNIGRGVGSSVVEVLAAMRRITGIDIEPQVMPRRAGDPAQIVGSIERITHDFGWHAQRDLDDMVRSAWAAWQHLAVEEVATR